MAAKLHCGWNSVWCVPTVDILTNYLPTKPFWCANEGRRTFHKNGVFQRCLRARVPGAVNEFRRARGTCRHNILICDQNEGLICCVVPFSCRSRGGSARKTDGRWQASFALCLAHSREEDTCQARAQPPCLGHGVDITAPREERDSTSLPHAKNGTEEDEDPGSRTTMEGRW